MFDPFRVILSAFTKFTDLGGPPVNFVLDFLSLFIAHNSVRTFGSSKVAAVPIYRLFIPCEQFERFAYITDICCRHIYSMNYSTVLVHPDMRFVPEMPVVSLLCLMRIGSRRFSLFLVEKGASMNVESTMVPLFQQQLFFLQNFPKSADGISIRNLVAGFHSTKLRKGTAVYDLTGGCLIRQVVQILQNMNSKHQFQIVRLVPALSFAIVRLYNSYSFAPRNDAVHLTQKFFFIRFYLCQFVAQS